MFVLETNPTSKLDKSGNVLIHCSIVVHAEAKLKGGYGGGDSPPPPPPPPPPTPDFAGHRGSLQGKDVEFDTRK